MDKVKQLFFAAYYGNKITYHNSWGKFKTEIEFGNPNSNAHILNGYLLLRSIKDLTDEEIINIADMYGWGSEAITKDRYDERLLQFKIDLPCICMADYRHKHMKFIFDYLLRIGILLPFTYLDEENKPITIQPEAIIELGWAKYIN